MSDLVITCPECGTRYKADPASFGPNGRTVRCARCQATWFVAAPELVEPIVTDPDALAHADNMTDHAVQVPSVSPDPNVETSFASAATAPSPAEPETPTQMPVTPSVGADVLMRNQVDQERLARRHRTIWLIWLIPLLIVIIAGVLAYLNRQAIVNRIPQMAALYQAVGIEVRQNGLEIDPPVATTTIVDGTAVIRVESAVRNLTKDPLPVPLIELILHDAAGQSLAQWYVEPEKSTLSGWGKMTFQTEYANPPDGVSGLRYRFSDDST